MKRVERWPALLGARRTTVNAAVRALRDERLADIRRGAIEFSAESLAPRASAANI